ncbi:T6SS amidase immunity protein Tai4 family protein [Snodgrassella alvi]|uniref:T6SS amidase immunity protein Tai4 family protein n=1 Tax=Snodgrassella alvi TaxID=1196083 RepID=UPI000C1F121A|nr:T6SS amidase immunity protein Tai4 family protein [Snodgrassella alvi]
MEIKVKLIFSLIVISISSAFAQARPPLKNDLENFTLSYCLAQSESGDIMQREAKAAVGAYVELGRYPAEAYEEAALVTRNYSKRPYKSYQEGVQLILMKCIDASQSKEIKSIKNRFSQRK